MKVMVMVKATPGSEAGKLPSEALMSAMGKFNEDLVAAGIMESGDGLKPTSEGYRVRFNGADRIVTKGPFIETNELVAGYWVWNVRSMEHAIEWVKKCPNPMEDEISDIEIRPYFAVEDFAEVDSDGAFAAKENALRDQLALQKANSQTYLFFGGRCDEAVQFYQTHLGAKQGAIFRFNESPDPVPEGMLQPGFENKVMHGEIIVGGSTYLISDGCDESTTCSGFALTFQLTDAALLEKTFNALAQQGEVIMPLMKTFFSPLYGQVKDQFGITWMVMIPGENPQGTSE
ncbi:hypothetical protein P886_0717 [Alteromonadaceae bacterium 2753L.S.0a.02]|nr:hypothetical protein P886_0717 [Alteromonadaceae bacterium 2753L.S.0a.02]